MSSPLLSTSSIQPEGANAGTWSFQRELGCFVTPSHWLRSRARRGRALGSATIQDVRLMYPVSWLPLAERTAILLYSTAFSAGCCAMPASLGLWPAA